MDSPVDIDYLFQADSEGENVPNITPMTSTTAQGNSREEMWTMYKKTFLEYDKRITNAWTKDAGGLLVFTGLFSAIVSAFIIESYKKLSPDSGKETVVLLGQISQQLASFTNSTYSNSPAIQPSDHPSTAIIAVNVMWLMSLVLSITSALFATLLQQWARRYIEMPQVPSSASQQARVRSFLFLGTVDYNMSIAVETVPTLLHLSVLLFFSGLVVFFFTIHKTVAIAASVSVGIFATLYFSLTIIPYFGYKCPYRTPMSDISWYPWHGLLSLAALFLQGTLGCFHSRPVPYDLDQAQGLSMIRAKLDSWFQTWKGAHEKHWNRFKSGIEKTIIEEALVAPVDVDRRALTRMFEQLALADRSDLPTFMATVPSDEIVRIMTPPFESGNIIFHEPLMTLIEGVQGLDDNKRRNCLLVWSAAVLHTIKQFFVSNQVPHDELVNYVLFKFADSSRMSAMCAHADTVIRLTSLSICALLAKWILIKGQFFVAEQRWLRTIFSELRDDIPNSLDNHMILDFLVRGVFPHQEGDGPNPGIDETANMSITQVSSFAETLAIIMDAGTQRPFDRRTFTQGLSDLVDPMEGGDIFVADNLRRIFPDYIQTPTATPAVAPVPIPTPIPALSLALTPALAPPEPESLSNKLRRWSRALFRVSTPINNVSASGVPLDSVP